MVDLKEEFAKALYYTHFPPPNAEWHPPVWEAASSEIQDWVRAQAGSVYDVLCELGGKIRGIQVSFGLLTATEVTDIPRVMRRVAKGYRATKTTRYVRGWEVAAELLERYADELEVLIVEVKRTEPRVRVRLDDTPPKKRLTEIAAISDKDIDTSDIPEAGKDFFKRAKFTPPNRLKKRVRL